MNIKTYSQDSRKPFIALLPTLLLTLFAGATSQAQQVSSWTNTSGGVWTEASNWDSSDAPVNGRPNANSQYVAEIDLVTGSPYQVSLERFDFVGLNGLVLDSADASLVIEGTLASDVQVTQGDLVLAGGLIRDGTITQTGGRILIGSFSNGSTIQETTIDGDLTFENRRSRNRFVNSTLSGGLDLNGGFLELVNSNQTFANTDVRLGGGISIDHLSNQPGFAGGASLVFEDSVNVSGSISIELTRLGQGTAFTNRTLLTANGDDETGVLSIQALGGTTEAINEGVILGSNGARLDLNDDFFSVFDGGLFTNASSGTISLTSGSSATLGSGSNNWRNDGLIELDDSRLRLRGDFDREAIGTITRANASEIVIGGAFDNESEIWELNETTGDFILDNGTITGGTVRFNGGELLFEDNGEGTSGSLSGARVEGTIRLAAEDSTLLIDNGGRFDQVNITGRDAEVRYSGTNVLASGESISLGNNGVVTSEGELIFSSGSSISGGGRISESSFFDESTISNSGLIDVNGRLIIDVDARVHGSNQFVNEGEIRVSPSSTLAVNASPFVGRFSGNFLNSEQGTINISTFSRVELEDTWRNLGTINIASNGVLNVRNFRIQSTELVAQLTEGTINRESGSVLSITSQLDNSGYVFELDQIGDLTLAGATISGGTINQNIAKLKFNNSLNRLNNVVVNGGLQFDESLARLTLVDSVVNGDVTTGTNTTLAGGGVFNAGTGQIVNRGTLNADSALELRVAPGGQIRNEGQLGVSLNSQLVIDGHFIQTFGSTRLNGGEITAADSPLRFEGGILEGSGVIDGDVLINSLFAIGGESSTGTISILGGIELEDSAAFRIDINGHNRGQTSDGYDSLVVEDSLILGGLLEISVDERFASSILEEDEFAIAEFGIPLSSVFDNVGNGDFLKTSDGMYRFQVNYGNGSVFSNNQIVLSNFSAVPEPSSAIAALFSTVALVMRRRRA